MTTEELRIYKREWMRKRRAAYFTGKVCSNCGSVDKLEIHHLDRTQKISHSVWSWRAVRREAELAKCIVLCEVCHQLETNKQLPEWKAAPITHGINESGYRRGCRCVDCKMAYSVIRKERYKRIRK